MPKLLKIILPILIVFFAAQPTFAEEQVNLYFFYGDGCPHCVKEEKFLTRIEQENKNIKIYRYETWHNRDNAKLLARIGKELRLDVAGVPILIVGDKTIVGYYSAETTGEKIRLIINDYLAYGCSDIVAPILRDVKDNNQCIHDCDQGDEECIHNCGCGADKGALTEIPKTINIPLFGEVKTKDISLPALTVMVAAIDGFNPCAMWVLLFLISLLLGMRDKKRMWILGSAFVITSGFVYFLFLSAWLNLFLFLGFVLWIRIAVGLVALASGGYHIRDWQQNSGVCKVTGSEKRRLIFEKIKKITHGQKFWLALAGIIVLAFAVNLVELICSAGLPAVYTHVLSLSNLAQWQYYAYLLLYVFIFMLDDLLVFFIAMTTLRMKAISSSYTRWSGLIGGVILLVIGVLLLFKPGWIMFG